MPTLDTYHPGNLVRARNREWVVQPGSTMDTLLLRPLGGTEDDVTTLLPELEFEAPTSATFPPPDPEKRGNHISAQLLRDALQLKFRAGAGPFRGFANIAVEPRAYQLVPLLMALRQQVVRLLIADDVGIGKTIEAGLIVRELFDRGEIHQCAVLCPPHLVDQWQSELERHFNIKASALTPSTATSLERHLPSGKSLIDHYPFLVVSLDYIKSDRHRSHFLSIAPDCIVVDEAHTCSTGRQGKQLRFELLKRLSEKDDRHLILLTATPHSGDELAFYNLLSILHPDFQHIHEVSEEERRRLRERLARHFVQRRRKDIEEWQDTSVFPARFTKEITYELSGDWGAFFDLVQDYCLRLAERIDRESSSARHVIWYATLALLRCVASSPAAAVKALNTRLEGTEEELRNLTDDSRIQDGEADDLSINDLEPAAACDHASELQALIAQAESLSGRSGDPKLAALMHHLEELLRDGFRPVVFCRYIATAHYVAAHLRTHFKKATVDAITGEFTPEEREQRVQDLGTAPQPILVATDCLSEGINLQKDFNAVVHYDLAWNPTRHEQREGRVDRFGQGHPEVRCTLLWGQDNPVDGFILNVILRKAEAIKAELGVLVPMPADEQRLNNALIKAALLKRKRSPNARQMELFEGLEPELKPIESEWENAMEKARANRTIFAQRKLKPEEVLPEWRRQLDAIGDEASIHRFVKTALIRLNSPLEPHGKSWRLQIQSLPPSVKDRLAEEGIDKPLILDFQCRPEPGATLIHRTHPLVATLADYLLEGALQEDHALAARCAVTITADVEVATSIYLLRLRHQLRYTRRRLPRTLMAEETLAIALQGRRDPQWIEGEPVKALLDIHPSGNPAPGTSLSELTQALERFTSQRSRFEALARQRADQLLADHQRVREAAKDVGTYEVSPCLPIDLMGVYVLLPDSL